MPRRDREKTQLLSRDQYDDDAPDVDDRPERLDPNSDDEETLDGRSSREIAETDREAVFEDDYEGDGLLVHDEKQQRQQDRGPARRVKDFLARGTGGLGGVEEEVDEKAGGPTRARRGTSADVKRSRRRKKLEGQSEMMFEMEEGGRLTPDSDEVELKSRESSEMDLQQLRDIRGQATRSRRRRRFRHAAIYLGIIVAFGLLLFAAYGASRETVAAAKVAQRIVSNGTALFPPTTILLSLDGFRADFLQRGITPNIKSFVESGVSPMWMTPSFPSVTFPNHYTMVTGLYPESHGIVGNTFWDPTVAAEFYYTHKDVANQPQWWGGQPLWETAERQGVRTAIHMWPGSEVDTDRFSISHVDRYNGSETLERKVSKIMEYLDLPGQEHEAFATFDNAQQRPQLIAAYVPVVDTDGHKFGPNSTEIRKTITDVDSMLGQLVLGLKQRNLTDIVNIVIVSDHGMATTDTSRLIQLEDLVNVDDIEHTDGWPLYGLRPRLGVETLDVYKQLKEKTKGNPNLDVYLRDVDMPERYHFSNNLRIAPLWIVPKAGWTIVTKQEFDVQEGLKSGTVYHPRGLHGYDNEHPLMRAIFVAKGPAFPHKPNSRVKVFQNTEVYNIVCDSLGIKAAPNNGTLRLPLKPIGLHSAADAPKLEAPADPPTHTPSSATSAAMSQTEIATSTSAVSDVVSSTTLSWVGKPTDAPREDDKGYDDDDDDKGHEDQDEDGEEDSARHRISKWWQWIKDKFHGAKDWVTHMVHGHHNSTETAHERRSVVL